MLYNKVIHNKEKVHSILDVPMKKILEINLTNNKLYNKSFPTNSPSNLKRPTKMYLYENQIDYLDEQVFQFFFQANQHNFVVISHQHFNESHEKKTNGIKMMNNINIK